MDKTNRWNEHLLATTTTWSSKLTTRRSTTRWKRRMKTEKEVIAQASDSDSSNQEIEKQGDQETSMVKANHFIRWYSCQSNGASTLRTMLMWWPSSNTTLPIRTRTNTTEGKLRVRMWISLQCVPFQIIMSDSHSWKWACVEFRWWWFILLPESRFLLLTDNKPAQHKPVTHHSKSNPYVDSPGTAWTAVAWPAKVRELFDSSRMKPLSEELGLMDGGDTGTVL